MNDSELSTLLNNRKRRPTHPGELLREDVLPAAGISQTALAERLGVSRRTINAIVNERRPVTTDIAHRLARMFDTTPDVWVTMQMAVDLWDSLQANRKAYERIKPLKVA
jgi:antitoxin HigA-1